MDKMNKNLSSVICRNILIVEDEQDIRENLKMLLELEGYKVFTAVNGEDGLKVLRTMERPCLILLDLLMPVMNGMEFLKEKRHEDTIAQIPVCIVSGVAEKPEMNGVSGFIKKPIDLDVLLKFIKSHCHPI
jgi:DNA-binding response OmpR family regulator